MLGGAMAAGDVRLEPFAEGHLGAAAIGSSGAGAAKCRPPCRASRTGDAAP